MIIEAPIDKKDRPSKITDFFIKFDKKSRRLARYLEKENRTLIYLPYSILDGLNTSGTLLRYGCDVFFTNSSLSPGEISDAFHNWMLGNWGLPFTLIEVLTITGIAFLGSYFTETNKYFLIQQATKFWPYLREVVKGLKNNYKSVRTVLKISEQLSKNAINLNSLVLPLGLLLGILGAINRVLIRRISQLRKDMVKANQNLLAEILKSSHLSAAECQQKLAQIQRQSYVIRATALCLSAFGGLIDSGYLYMGTLLLGGTSLIPPLFIALTSICILYSLCNIASGIFEEYNEQRKLTIEVLKAELAIYVKKHTTELNDQFQNLLDIKLRISQLGEVNLTSEQAAALTVLKSQEAICIKRIRAISQEFKRQGDTIQKYMEFSLIEAVLIGFKHGLAGYGAVTSLLLPISLILVLTTVGAVFPPAVIMAVVCSGLIFLTIAVVHSVLKHHFHNLRLRKANQRNEILQLIDAFKEAKPCNASELQGAIHKGMTLKSNPQFFVTEYFELLRSFCSFFNKAPKTIDMMLNPCQEIGETGHYQDTIVMVVISYISAFLFGIIGAIRAHARGFGRDVKDSSLIPFPESSTTASSESDSLEVPEANPQLIIEEDLIVLNAKPPHPEEDSLKPILSRTPSYPSFFKKSSLQQKPVPSPCLAISYNGI